MAGLLLWAVCASMTGCLFPQDDQVFPELPPKRNGPMEIVNPTPLGPRVQFFNGTTCTNTSFKVTVEDEDLADLTFSRWFIDGTNTQPFVPSSIQGGTARRDVNAPFALKTNLANRTAGTIVTLTVFVADTDFEVVDGKAVLNSRDLVLPDGGVLPDDGSSDMFTWTLDIVACQ
jgi:hypothetical protein